MRRSVQRQDMIKRHADLDPTREPSVVGIDGSYQTHRLMALDLAAAAAVAVEGTSKEARRHWEKPHHDMWVRSFEHNKHTTNTLRGLMVSMEIFLADKAPHDLVLLDGSFIALLIYLNQGLSVYSTSPQQLHQDFLKFWEGNGILDRFLRLLESNRTAAVPKYSSRNELKGSIDAAFPDTDGRTLATIILHPGEYIVPLEIFRFDGEDDEFHLPRRHCSEEFQDKMNQAIGRLRVVFYRPYGWAPAVRLELPGGIANSNTRLSMVLEGIKRQFFSSAVSEPYPLYIADRMVKSLGAGVKAIELAAAQQAAGSLPHTESTLMCLQNYRTEGGRGGT